MSRNPHPEHTRQRILDAARILFAANGYEHTSIQQIMAATALSKGAIYHHFPSKEAILEALSASDIRQYQAAVDTVRASDSTALDKLRTITFDYCGEPEHLTTIRAMLPMLNDPKTLANNLASWRTDLTDLLNELIDEGLHDGSINTEYPQEAAQLLALLSNYWLVPLFYPADEASITRRIRCLATMMNAIGIRIFDEQTIAHIRHAMTLLVTSDDADTPNDADAAPTDTTSVQTGLDSHRKPSSCDTPMH